MARLGRTRLLTALITVCFAMVLPAVAFAPPSTPAPETPAAASETAAHASAPISRAVFLMSCFSSE